ncbi:MAG: TIGR03619 family F420-dependent LLM class oxidoreductase [Nitriliruptorales bacterium]
MELGVAIFPTDRTIRPDRLAREVEDRGFGSLFFPEHTHMPVDHSPHPSGQPLPDEYRRTYDLFVALTAAAAATERLTIGTGICLVAQRDPIVLAKEVASLDVLSGGRLVFGVGYGWNRPEAAHHGIRFADRRDVLREKVLAMRHLWTEEEARFDGAHVEFEPTWLWPKPAQQPHPPILLGAAPGPLAFSHLVEFCDGWMPIGARDVRDHLGLLHDAAERAGRDPTTLSVTVYGTKPDPGRLTELAELGVERTVVWLPSADEATVLDRLDRYTALLAELD